MGDVDAGQLHELTAGGRDRGRADGGDERDERDGEFHAGDAFGVNLSSDLNSLMFVNVKAGVCWLDFYLKERAPRPLYTLASSLGSLDITSFA